MDILPRTMQAVKAVGPDQAVLHMATPVPDLRPGYLLIKVLSVALNPTDCKGVAGFGRDTPHTIDCDVAGILVAYGDSTVKRYSLGDRLAGLCIGIRSGDPTSGAFGEYALLKEALSLRVPDQFSDAEAATLPVGINTVGQALYQTFKLPLPRIQIEKQVTGPTILIYGGSTATGLFAVQFARLSGCRVLATCSPLNFRLLKALGAHATFDYYDARACAAAIREETGDSLLYAFDCISQGESLGICANALTSQSGKAILTATLPVAGRFPRQDVEHGWRSGYTAFGETWTLLGKEQSAAPNDLEFATGFWQLVKRLLHEDCLRLGPLVRYRKGGLAAVPQGLKELREGGGEPGKLVFLLTGDDAPQDHYIHLYDVLGQLPFLKTYSHLMLCFPLSDDQRDHAIESLRAAARKLSEAIPWLAGKVVSDNGVSKVKPCSYWTTPKLVIRYHDRTEDIPPYDTIFAANGPSDVLDGGVLAPCRAFPESYQETDENPAAVLIFQANFIRGGILPDCAAQHNFIDMSGIEQCFKLLACAMNGKALPPTAIQQANRNRRDIIPLLGLNEGMLDHSNFLRSTSLAAPTPVHTDSPYSWRYFRITRQAIVELKALARETSPQASAGDEDIHISRNDALSAFCWQRICRARFNKRSGDLSTPVKFCRALNGRPAMMIPSEYVGDVVTIAMSHSTLGELTSSSLGAVAHRLRTDLLKFNNAEYIRSFATWIAKAPEKTLISYGGNFDPDRDIGSSSWAHVKLYSESFGSVLEKPQLIRRPDFAPLKSDVYFMPETVEGDIDALLCLKEVDFDGLEEDKIWTRFAEYVG